MPTFTRFEEIEEWQTARELTLNEQIRRASVSEVHSRLYASCARSYTNNGPFSKLLVKAEKLSRQTARFISYLETHPNHRKRVKMLLKM